MNETKKQTAFVKYIIGLLLFGSNGIVADKINLSSYDIVLYRTLIGSIFLLALYFLLGNRLSLKNDSKKELLYVILSGISMGASWIFLYEAYGRIGVGVASLAYYCGPVIVMVLSPLIFKEKLSKSQIFCFIIVLAGVVLTDINEVSGSGDMYGLFCGLMSAFMHALMVIFTMKAPNIKGIKNSAVQLSVSFFAVLCYTIIFKSISVPTQTSQWLWIMLLGVINTGFGCYLYFSSIGALSVPVVSVWGYLEPLSAVLFSVILLNEKLLPMQILGAVLIIGGAAASEMRSSSNKSANVTI